MALRQAVGHGVAARVGRCALRGIPLLVLALGLVGCAESDDVSPKRPMISEIMPLAGSTNVIHVVPVQGLDRPLQLVLADAVAASLRDMQWSALLSTIVNDRGPTLRGRVEKLRERGSIVWVNSVWQLLAPYGTAVAEERREVVIDKRLWDRQAVEVVNLLIRESMVTIAEMVADHVGPLNVVEDAPPPPPSTQIVNEPATVMPRTLTVQRAKSPTPPTLPVASETSVDISPSASSKTTPPVAAELIAKVVDEPEKTNMAGDALPQTAGRPPISLTPKDSNVANELTAPPETVSEPASTAMVSEKPMPDSATTFELRTREMSPPSAAPEPEIMELEPTPIDATPPKTMAVEPPKSPESKIVEAGIPMPERDAPVVWGRPSFLIRPVKGAPGDGNAALSAAIKAALRSRDLTITEDPRQAGYEVIGNVDVGIAVNGRQRAKINWTVNTIGGDEVGKAVQENIIAAGSLDGPWGRVAEIVSLAAADGIQHLFNAPKRKTTTVGYVPDFPKIPKLPWMPGRALPPAPN